MKCDKCHILGGRRTRIKIIVIPDKGAKATADPVSSATVKRRSLLPLCFEHKEQNASRFGICAGFRLGARFRSLVRNDDKADFSVEALRQKGYSGAVMLIVSLRAHA